VCSANLVTCDEELTVPLGLTQIPCGAVKACPEIDDEQRENPNATYTYSTLGGAVVFRAEDLPNAAAWVQRSDVNSPRYDMAANHVCSYMCWLSQVGVSIAECREGSQVERGSCHLLSPDTLTSYPTCEPAERSCGRVCPCLRAPPTRTGSVSRLVIPKPW
jgi:hypothetical protein